MAADIPVYESVPTIRMGADTIRVGDSLYSFDSADGGYLWSGTAPPLGVPGEDIEPLPDIGYWSMFGGTPSPDYPEIPLDRDPITPPVGVIEDPMTPDIVPFEEYPSGYGLMSPLGEGIPSRIDWSTVSDISRGGGGALGDIVVGSGGELMMGVPGGWDARGSLYDTPFWTPHEEYGHAGFGALTVPEGLPSYESMLGPRPLSGSGWGYELPVSEPDYTGYVESYPDLGAAYTAYKDSGGPKYPTVGDYGEWHWGKYGEPEGREMVTTDPYIPEHWYPYSEAPPEILDPFFPTDTPPIVPPITDSPSFGVLESIATGTPVEPEPTGTLPPAAPPVEPVVETTPPMMPVVDPYVEPLAPPVEEPYAPSPPVELEPLIETTPITPPVPLGIPSGISGSPIAAAMKALDPSFDGGGGLLCDPITGKCPQYR